MPDKLHDYPTFNTNRHILEFDLTGTWLLIQRYPDETESEGGVLLPNAEGRCLRSYAHVLKVSALAEKEFPDIFAPGDTIEMSPHVASDIDSEVKGVAYVMAKDVIGVVSKEYADVLQAIDAEIIAKKQEKKDA